MKQLFYVGTFSEYVYVMEFDSEEQKISAVSKVYAPRRSAYFAVSDDYKCLYVANENHLGKGGGGVTAFNIQNPCQPSIINAVQSFSEGPSYIAAAKIDDRHFVLGAGFFDGDITVYPIRDDGSVGELCCKIQLYGGGPFVRHKGKNFGQENARAHCIEQVPGTPYIIATDLGSDKIYTFSLNREGQLSIVSTLSVYAGAGPRHFVLSRSGDLVYLITELSSVLITMDFDKETGELKPKQYLSALPDDAIGDSYCSAICFSADRRFIYGANRGHNSIAVLSTEAANDCLSTQGYFNEMVAYPRDFAVDRTGAWLLIGNERDKIITINLLDQKTGMPRYTGHSLKMEEGPVCFKFLEYTKENK